MNYAFFAGSIGSAAVHYVHSGLLNVGTLVAACIVAGALGLI